MGSLGFRVFRVWVEGLGFRGFFLSPPCATHTSSKTFKRFSVARRRSQQMRAKAFVFMYEVFLHRENPESERSGQNFQPI